MIERPISFGELPPVPPNPAKKVYIAMTKFEVPCIIRYSIETGCQKQSVHMHLPPGQRSPFANICHFNSFIPSKSPQEWLLGVQNFAKMRRVCVSAGEDCGCKCMGLLSPQVAVAGLRLGWMVFALSSCNFLWSLRAMFFLKQCRGHPIASNLLFDQTHLSLSPSPLSLNWLNQAWLTAVFLPMPILEFWSSWSLASKRRSVLLWNVIWKFNTQIYQQLSHGNSPGSELSTLMLCAVSVHKSSFWHHTRTAWSMFKSMCRGNASSSILAGPGLGYSHPITARSRILSIHLSTTFISPQKAETMLRKWM